MPAPIPVPVRQTILRRWQQGETVTSLAEDLHLSPRTIRHLVRRFAQQGPEGLAPDYARCATKQLPADSDIFQKALHFRQQHPRWGAGLIRVMLQEEHEAAPSVRTLQRWFERHELAAAPPGRRPVSEKQRARYPHEVWQMDAVDQLRLGSGQRVSWLRLVDECSGAVLKTTIFPPMLLEHGRAHHGARDLTRGFFPVGQTPAHPSRQRRPLGIERRLADRPGAVVDRLGYGHDLESSQTPSR